MQIRASELQKGMIVVRTQIGDSDTITFRFEDGREESIVCADLFAVPD